MKQASRITKPLNIKFKNATNPHAAFDLVQLDQLFERKNLDHDPEQLHRVNFFILLFITEGHGQHTIDFTDYNIQRGSLLTIRKDQLHKFFKRKNINGYLLLFTDEFLVSYLEKLEAQKSLQLFNEQLGLPKIQLLDTDYQTIYAIIQRIKKEYTQQMDDYTLGIIRSELHILITKLYRIKSTDNQIIVNKQYLSEFITFQQLVEQNVTNTNRVGDYANMMAISTKTLNNISRNIVDKSAKAFIHEISIKQIKRLLINTTLSIKEIAYASGFEEATNFYKYFKRLVGTTPEQFRTSH